MKNHEVTTDGIVRVISVGAVSINETKGLYTSQYQKKGTKSVELRQEINTKADYPNAKVSNNMQDNLFTEAEFGFEMKEYTSKEGRVAWLDVPEAMTIDQVKAALAASPEACIYKVLSNAPILTDDQAYVIGAGLRTKDEFADSQAIRFPENHPSTPNKLILDPKGNIQYRAVFFSKTDKEDQDHRGTSPVYASAALLSEKSGVSSDATLVASQGL